MNINEKALFIGPYGENKEAFALMVQMLLEDITQWRRNFHPKDARLVSSRDKRAESFADTMDATHTALDHLLGDMKGSVPFHSPRFMGHMHTDLAIPALLGYFTGMLYNQNNVVGESSPITTVKEIEYIKRLCAMVGYQGFDLKDGSFGHLCSGGTTANLEAMWVARNLKYYPISIKLLAHKKDDFHLLNEISVLLPNGQTQLLRDTTCHTLFNLSKEGILALKSAAIEKLAEITKDYEAAKSKFDAIHPYLVQHLGVTGIHQLVQDCFDFRLELPMLYMSRTGHYSWKKSLDVLGLGVANVELVDVDALFHLDLDQLQEKMTKNQHRGTLAVIGMLGTTEEGAIDPIQSLVALRKEMETSEGHSFYLHVDGAYGGYFCAMLRADAETKGIADFEAHYGQYLQGIKSDLGAVAHSDSISIDPHKLGFIPYAVGAILFSDTRLKGFIYKSAPYLAKSGEEALGRTYLGGWTLEGSRSGAAALACFMASEVIPHDVSGYGALLAKTIRSTRKLHGRLLAFNARNRDIRIVPFYRPDTNLLCFSIAAPDYIHSPQYLNLLSNAVYDNMSVVPSRVLPDYKFITSKTEFDYRYYKSKIDHTFAQSGIVFAAEPGFELVTLRCTLMNPCIEDIEDNLFDGFIKEIESVAQKALPSVLMEIVAKQKNRRIKLLWVENNTYYQSVKNQFEIEGSTPFSEIGRYFDITFYDYQRKGEGLRELLEQNTYDTAVVDLNLLDNDHVEWESGMATIHSVVDAGIKPIVYSGFFKEHNTVDSALQTMLLVNFGDSIAAHQLIKKVGGEGEKKDIGGLVKGIFRVLQG